ncbi:MAG: ComF family protein [Bacteroidia bacterium]
MKKLVLDATNAVINLLFPETCCGCENILNSNEKNICAICLATLPKTNWQNFKGNPLEKIFYARVPLNRATSFLHFRKDSITQNFLHNLKYNSQKQLGVMLGYYFAYDLKKAVWANQIDAIIPIPLHPKKLKIRGYNQSTMLCIGISKGLKTSMDIKSLKRVKFTETQTKKDRAARQKNVSGAFTCKPFEYKNILLVDDVTTTGATFESAANALLKSNPNCKINIATLAAAE